MALLPKVCGVEKCCLGTGRQRFAAVHRSLSLTQLSPVARHQDADYVTFRDGEEGRHCIGFRRMGGFQRGGYDSVTGGILCAPSGKTVTDNDIALFIDNVRLQGTPGASRR